MKMANEPDCFDALQRLSARMNEQPQHQSVASVVAPALDQVNTKIIATILCGNSESLIEAAILSVVGWVDEICVIDTGITDATLDRLTSVSSVKISHSSFRWCNDFAKARNFALTEAEKAGAAWALTLDTDERLEFTGYDNQQQLIRELESEPRADSWMAWAQDASYAKTRFIRVPTTSRWQGRTHESWVGSRDSRSRILEGCEFWEDPKTPQQFQSKVERDLSILLAETAAQPHLPRWWYYLGQTYEALRMYQPAIDAFEKCIRLDGWPEESSWACYAAGRCCVSLKEYRQAEEYCALGMTRKPSVPELPWLAGWCCFKRRAWSDAIIWSQLAIVLAQDNSISRAAVFRHLPAWYEAPYDVLRYAYRQLGLADLAENAEIEFQTRQTARLQRTNRPMRLQSGGK